jgi:ribosomal protein S18 acetylase RimI-like enzyme
LAKFGDGEAISRFPCSAGWLDLSAGGGRLMPITIREATPGDEKLLAVLNGLAHELHIAQRPDFFREAKIDEISDWFRDLWLKQGTRIWIAKAGDLPVGYVLAFFREQISTTFCLARRWCEIDQIAVDAKHRREGIARTLVHRVVEQARHEGIHQIETNVWCFNDGAQEMFDKLGFTSKVLRFELRLSTDSRTSVRVAKKPRTRPSRQ